MNTFNINVLYVCHIAHTYKVWRNLLSLAQFQDLVLNILWSKTFLNLHTISNSLLFFL